MEDRYNRIFRDMTEQEKYDLMLQLEGKELGENDKADKEFFSNIVDLLLEGTTMIAAALGIVKVNK